MNKDQFKNYWLKIGGISLVSYIIVLLIFIFINKSQTKKINDINKNINDLTNLINRHKYFASYLDNIKIQVEEISKIIETFKSYIIQDDRIESIFLREISKNSKLAKIKLDNISKVNSTSTDQKDFEKVMWNISLVATFPQFGEFLTLMEKSEYFWGLENFSINSGKEKTKHQITLSIFSILPSTASLNIESQKFMIEDANFNFAEFQQTSNKNLDKIKMKQKEILSSFVVDRDPFFWGDTLFPVKTAEKRMTPPPELLLQGITWEEDTPLAVINNKVLKEGDVIKGAKVIKITEQYVIFGWEGRRFTIELKRR